MVRLDSIKEAQLSKLYIVLLIEFIVTSIF
jgi:hypothetical protein